MSHIIPLKTCNKCHEEKPALTDYFPVRHASKDGLGYTCHECNRAKANAWRKADPERAKETDRRKYEKQQAEREANRVYDYIYPLSEQTCSKCGVTYPANPEYFHIRQASHSGLSYICRKCNVAHVREWRKAHPDRYAEYNESSKGLRAETKKEWRKRNPELVRKMKSESQKRNRASANKRFRRFTTLHPERTRESGRNKYYSRIAREGRDFIRVANHKRRAHKMNNGGTHTAAEIKDLYIEQDGCCGYCGITLHGEYHEDHMKPLSRGGSNDIENIVLTCAECNLSKNDKTFEEWKAVRGW